MEYRYCFVVSIRTPGGMLQIGTFYIGNDIDFALTTFGNLKGNSATDEKSILRIDLVKKLNGKPVQYIAHICCMLDQYVENCKIITRDAFKFFAIEHPQSYRTLTAIPLSSLSA